MRTRLTAIGVMLAAIAGMSTSRAAAGNVDLLWIPQPRTIDKGMLFEIGLFAVSGDGNQSIVAMDVVLTWDPTLFELVGVVNNGPYNWLQSGFLNDSGLDGLNDKTCSRSIPPDAGPCVFDVDGDGPLPPEPINVCPAGETCCPAGETCQNGACLPVCTSDADCGVAGETCNFGGDAMYTALANLGNAAAVATPDGLLVTTFQFVALAETDRSDVVIKDMLGMFSVTQVFGGESANQLVTGMLHNATLTVVSPRECDGDGDFDLRELDGLQACFTGRVTPDGVPSYPAAPELCCEAFDRDGDGDVDLTDFTFLVGLVNGPGQ